MMLEGEMEIEFDDRVVVFRAGDGIFIPPGEKHRHRPKAISETVRVIFVEDV
jgi:quercetin dioxygenase-like cupin family protein